MSIQTSLVEAYADNNLEVVERWLQDPRVDPSADDNSTSQYKSVV
jgi:hypothetical protein